MYSSAIWAANASVDVDDTGLMPNTPVGMSKSKASDPCCTVDVVHRVPSGPQSRPFDIVMLLSTLLTVPGESSL